MLIYTAYFSALIDLKAEGKISTLDMLFFKEDVQGDTADWEGRNN